MLESELFGHEKGSFTGALARKIGKFELADGGTLFLDEIGEMPRPLQAKLLRAIQEREVDRVGGRLPVPVNFRLIAATHRNLEAEVEEQRFRADLYYRLNVLYIKLPPLRERADDIPLLARHFLAKYADEGERVIRGISPEAGALLQTFDWPGNVRQLENVIQRAVAMGSEEWIGVDDLPDMLKRVELKPQHMWFPAGLDYYELVDAFKQQLLEYAYGSAGSCDRAASLLGLHPSSFRKMLKAFKVKHLVKPHDRQ